MTSVKWNPPLEKLAKQILDVIENPLMKRRILLAGAKALAIIAAGRPPEGAWNRAPGTRGDNRWYQRGFGSRWKKAGGGLGGAQNSQNLQKSWNAELVDDDTSVAFTAVTYAPFIHETGSRVWWAESHGWKTDEELTNIFATKFEEIALKEIDEMIDEIGK